MNLELADQLAMMANCFEIIGPELRECAAKHQRLVKFINDEQPQ